MNSLLTEERVLQLIHKIRDQKVMLDSDLEEMYGVETRVLKQAVRRNPERFPDDFMFELTEEEWESVKGSLRSQIVILKKTQRGKHGKYLPFVFNEQGVSMLSSVFNSPPAGNTAYFNLKDLFYFNF